MSARMGVSPNVHTERRSDLIRGDEVARLFRLEGELGELPRESEEQRRHALEGLSALVGAQVGIWASFGELAQTKGIVVEALHLGWSGERERRTFVDFLGGGQLTMPDPSVARVARAMDGPLCTFSRAQLMSDRAWYREPHVQEIRRAGGVDGFLHSVRVGPQGGYVVSLHRPWGARPFTERERRLVDLFHRESRALAPRKTDLPPHLDRTLRALLRGLGEKQVAAELDLSPHTVHEYVRALYRRFGVGSRAELFAKLGGAR